ncbi:MAG: hypothetical protein RBT34_03230 [Anaerolineaceae bacterium]|nr:hypothetical protein [Anaerolineaceae bacterium]
MKTRTEKKWLLVYALAVLGVTSVPYVMGFALQGEAWRYTGFVFGVEDGNSYLAKMLSGAYGAWLFKTPYTAYPQSGFFGFFPYLLLGKVSVRGWQHSSLVVLFHAFRWLGGVLMIWATYDFASIFIEKIRYRRWATVLATLGGGIGWLTVFGLNGLWGERMPLEFYSPESFGFLSIYGLPHLAFARAMLLWGLARYLRCSGRSWKAGLATSGLWLGLSLMQPITVVVGGTLIGWHLVITGMKALIVGRAALKARWREQFGFAVKMAILPAPVVVYTAWAFLNDPFLGQWSTQNIIQSPPFGDYLLAYGGMLILAAAGLKAVFRQEDQNVWLFLLGWVVLFPVLAYLPFSVQRRLPEGVWAAISVLGVSSVSTMPKWFQKAAHVFFGVSILPAVILLLGGVTAVMNIATPLYRPAKEVEVFEWLRTNGSPGDVVLAAYDTANPLPAWTPMRGLVGHGPESVHLEAVNARVGAFYAESTLDAVRRDLIEEFAIRYVIYGPEEDSLGRWKLENAPYLALVYENTDYQVFQVIE